MADRRAAAFQLRSSNIRVAPLDAPGVDPGSYLVVYRAGKPAKLLGKNRLVSLPPEQHDLVPDLHPLVRPEHAGVHSNPPEKWPPDAPDQGAGPPRQGPPVPLRVSHRHRRRQGRLLRPERQPVGDTLPGREPPDIRDV